MSAYLNFNNRRGGKNTVTINGVEYYQSQSYGIPSYYHLNEKRVGGKKSQVVSDVLDVAIPKLTKYGLSAAALAGPILAGNPEFAPATLLLASDLHEPLGKKLRKTIKEKTGYGVYQGKTKKFPTLDEDEDELIIENKPQKKAVNKNIVVEEMAVSVVKKAPAKKAPAKPARKAPAKKAPSEQAVTVTVNMPETVAVKKAPAKPARKAPAKKAPAVKPPMAPAKKALPPALKKWQVDVKKYSEKNNMPYKQAMIALSEKRKNCGSAESCYVKAKKAKMCKC